MLSLKTVLQTLLVVMLLAGCRPDDTAEEVDSPVDSVALAEPVLAPDTLEVLDTQTGEATFYADVLDRQRTASGEILDQSDLVAAHRRFPFGTIVRVTNLRNDRSVDVRIIDRGPFGAPKVAREKVIDLSRQAARQLGIIQQGRAVVRVDVLSYGNGPREG